MIDTLHSIVLTSALTIRRLAGGNVDLDHKNTLKINIENIYTTQKKYVIMVERYRVL